ncbi:MAG: transposase [Devosia sp.]
MSLRSIAICVVDGEGQLVLERTVACEVDDIVTCLPRLPDPILKVGVEVGAMSQHLFFGLQAAGLNVVCMEARQVHAALSAMRNKTDKNDAREIAHVRRSGWFNPVHMKSREAHAVSAGSAHGTSELISQRRVFDGVDPVSRRHCGSSNLGHPLINGIGNIDCFFSCH